MGEPLWQLLRNRNFMLVWWAGLISGIGNYTLFVALPVYIYSETTSTLATGMSVMASALPAIVVGQVTGVFVDRWDYQRTMLVTNLMLVGTALLFLVLRTPWWLLIPVAFVKASVGTSLGPAENALLPTLVAQQRLGAANSLNALNNNLARLVGPAVGGLLIAEAGFSGVVIVDALTYLVAALLVASVSVRNARHASTDVENSYERLLLEWRMGLSAVRFNRLLRLSFVAAALVGFGEGFVSTLIAPFVKVMLGGTGPELGYLFSAQAVGGIAAGLLLTGLAGHFPTFRLLGWGGLLSGLLLIPIFNYPLFYPVLWPTLVLTALAGLPFAAWRTAQMMLLQTEANPQVRGRVFSAYVAISSLTQLLGMAASGLLGDDFGVMIINTDAATYLLAGVIVFVIPSLHRATSRASTQNSL